VVKRLPEVRLHRGEYFFCGRRRSDQQEIVLSLVDRVPFRAEMSRQKSRPRTRSDFSSPTKRRAGKPAGQHMQKTLLKRGYPNLYGRGCQEEGRLLFHFFREAAVLSSDSCGHATSSRPIGGSLS